MSGESSPHYPLVGWLWLGVGRWLAGWLVAAGWLRGWLGGYGSLANRGWLKPRPTNLLDEKDDSSCC